MIDTCAVIQARMGSTRLPGKIFKKINGITVLDCLFEQLKYSHNLKRKIIATTLNIEDDKILEFGKIKNIDVFRGSSLDVLDRFYQCAKKNNLKNIIRITSDCPLIDPYVIDEVIVKYELNNYDYVSNFFKTRCPSGLEVEIFSIECLENVWINAKDYDREHVTSYIYKNPDKFKIGYIEGKRSFNDLHLSVDTLKDLDFIKKIYQRCSSKPITFNQILQIISSNPSILNYNNSKI